MSLDDDTYPNNFSTPNKFTTPNNFSTPNKHSNAKKTNSVFILQRRNSKRFCTDERHPSLCSWEGDLTNDSMNGGHTPSTPTSTTIATPVPLAKASRSPPTLTCTSSHQDQASCTVRTESSTFYFTPPVTSGLLSKFTSPPQHQQQRQQQPQQPLKAQQQQQQQNLQHITERFLGVAAIPRMSRKRQQRQLMRYAPPLPIAAEEGEMQFLPKEKLESSSKSSTTSTGQRHFQQLQQQQLEQSQMREQNKQQQQQQQHHYHHQQQQDKQQRRSSQISFRFSLQRPIFLARRPSEGIFNQSPWYSRQGEEQQQEQKDNEQEQDEKQKHRFTTTTTTATTTTITTTTSLTSTSANQNLLLPDLPSGSDYDDDGECKVDVDDRGIGNNIISVDNNKNSYNVLDLPLSCLTRSPSPQSCTEFPLQEEEEEEEQEAGGDRNSSQESSSSMSSSAPGSISTTDIGKGNKNNNNNNSTNINSNIVINTTITTSSTTNNTLQENSSWMNNRMKLKMRKSSTDLLFVGNCSGFIAMGG